ncbi:MAG: hypothetical protein O3A46_02770, partial [Candidatus Poribacteria bacterium]|nr:hypothetical protein [Candidatus Poribacteria bacterium]
KPKSSAAGMTPLEVTIPIPAGRRTMQIGTFSKTRAYCHVSIREPRAPIIEPLILNAPFSPVGGVDGLLAVIADQAARAESDPADAIRRVAQLTDRMTVVAEGSSRWAELLLERAPLLCALGKTNVAIMDGEAILARERMSATVVEAAQSLIAAGAPLQHNDGSAIRALLLLGELRSASVGEATLLGVSYLRDGDATTALRQFAAVLDNAPNHADALFYSSLATLRAGEWDAASAYLERLDAAIRTDAAVDPVLRGQATYLLAVVELERGETDSALQRLDALTSSSSTDAPIERAMRRQVAWFAGRVRRAETLRSDSTETNARLAAFNVEWADAPSLRWNEATLRQLEAFRHEWKSLSSDALPLDSARFALQRADSSERVGRYLILSDVSPTKIQVVGPTALRMELRALLPPSASPNEPFDLRCSIEDEDGATVWSESVRATPVSSDLVLADIDGARVGIRRQLVYHVPAGSHTLSLRADHLALARFSTATPLPGTPSLDRESDSAPIIWLEPASSGASATRANIKSGTDRAPENGDAAINVGRANLSEATQESDFGERSAAFNDALIYLQDLAEQFPERDEPGALLSEARRQTQWQNVFTASESSGYEWVAELEQAEPSLDEALLERESSEAGSVRLSPDQPAEYALTLAEPATMAVWVFARRPMDADAVEPLVPVSVEVRVDGESVARFGAAVGKNVFSRLGALSGGAHVVEVVARTAYDDAIIRASLLVNRPLNTAETPFQSVASESELGWWDVMPVRSRRYLTATEANPVRAFLQGPTQLRVQARWLLSTDMGDAMSVRIRRRGEVDWSTHEIPMRDATPDDLAGIFQSERIGRVSGQNDAAFPLPDDSLYEIDIAPNGDETSTLAVRLSARVANESVEPKPLVAVTPVSLYYSALSQEAWSQPDFSVPTRLFSRVSGGTWEIIAGYGEDRQEEGGETVNPRYGTFALRHRFGVGNTFYHRLTLKTNVAETGNPVWSADESLDGGLFGGIRWTLDGSVDAQRVGSSDEFATDASLELRRVISMGRRIAFIPRIGGGASTSTMTRVELFRSQSEAEDLFSEYRLNHNRQLFAGYTLWTTPFLDLILYDAARARSNRDLSPSNLDFAYHRIGARKLWKQRLDTHVYHELRRWFQDDHRLVESWENRVYGRAEWLLFGSPFPMYARLTGAYTVDNRDLNVYFSLTTRLNASRNYDDYPSADVDFEWQKESRFNRYDF